jgi:hypothetical protein
MMNQKKRCRKWPKITFRFSVTGLPGETKENICQHSQFLKIQSACRDSRYSVADSCDAASDSCHPVFVKSIRN